MRDDERDLAKWQSPQPGWLARSFDRVEREIKRNPTLFGKEAQVTNEVWKAMVEAIQDGEGRLVYANGKNYQLDAVDCPAGATAAYFRDALKAAVKAAKGVEEAVTE